MEDIDLLKRRVARERAARLQAEAFLEQKALDLYRANERLRHLNENLEQEIRAKLAELDRSEQRYRQLIESVQDIIYKISPQGVFTFVSPVVEKLLGYTPAEFVGRHFTRFTLPGHRRSIYTFYRAMIDDQQDSTYHEFPMLAKDGRTVWIGQTVRLIEVDGQVIELVAVARDVSDRKFAELELATTQVRLSTLITNLQSGILVEDENQRVMLVNQLFCDMFAITARPADLVGFDCGVARQQAKLLFTEPESFVKRMDELLRERRVCVGEEIYMANGRILEFDYIPIFFDNQYMGHLWKYSDVTETYMAREQIRKSEEKYRGIMNNMELGLLEVDNNRVIVRAYERFCNMVGYQEAELIGRNATELTVPEYADLYIAHQPHNAGRASSYEVQLVKKDGNPIWMLVSGVPIWDENGEKVGDMAIQYDVTERKVLVQELARAKQIAEDARYAEKQFLANMSHEIRTPLNAVIGMSHLLFDTNPSRQQREYIDILKTSADFLHSLISDLLDMTKIEAGRVEINARPFDLAGLLRATQRVFELKMQDRPVSVDVMIDARIAGDFVGDDVMLNQILLNLVGNADKFTEEGHIQITARIKKEEAPVTWIEFTIADTGIGIPAEKLEVVFQKFRQVNAHGHKHKGTGLGLAITKELVEIQGGTISVRSQIGQGSQFTFTLPFTKATSSGTPARIGHNLPAADARIARHVLVVEDNQMNQKYIGSLLTKWNVDFSMASDGRKAVELAKEQAFDLILMDVQMPIMDGYEATLAIRSTHNPNQNVPIVALTASAMLDHKNTAMEVGMNEFLTKPFEPGQLLTVLQRYAPAGEAQPGPPPAAKSAPVLFSNGLDQRRLTDLYGTDRTYAADMFHLFLTDVVPELQGMPGLCRAQNWPALARTAHKLKPTLGMVGLSQLEEKLNRIEAGLQQDNPPDFLATHCDDMVADLNKLLPLLTQQSQQLSRDLKPCA